MNSRFIIILIYFLSFSLNSVGKDTLRIKEITVDNPFLKSGDTLLLKVVITNGDGTYWMGLSLRDPLGRWFDVPSQKITLSSQEQTMTFKWRVPNSTDFVSGDFSTRVAIWDRAPEEPDPVRIEYVDLEKVATIFRHIDDFDHLDYRVWRVIEKRTPGLGFFKAENVIVQDGLLQMKFPILTKDGGEIATNDGVVPPYGTFRAKIKTPSKMKGTYTTFFLYNPHNEDEVDIELWNNKTNQIDFTIWIKATKIFSDKVELPFDPSKEFHEYRIDFYPGEISFWVDGQKYSFYKGEKGMPTSKMKIYINNWWPKWMEGSRKLKTGQALYDYIKY